MPISKISDNRIKLSGILNADIVINLLDQLSVYLEKVQQLTVDLHEVSYSDSTGLALLIEWLRQAKLNNKSIIYVGMPEQMRAIAHVSGIEKILSLSESQS